VCGFFFAAMLIPVAVLAVRSRAAAVRTAAT
jgi:hypothetical protein